MELASAAAAVFAAGCLAARPQTNAAAPASVATQVIILGTLHGGHKANTNYSLDILRDVIVAMKPSAILVELPPEIGCSEPRDRVSIPWRTALARGR